MYAEHRVRTPSGEWKWLLSRGKVTERDPQTGKALRMSGTDVDITARKLGEQTLHETEEEVASDSPGLIHESDRRAEKIKSISRKIVENAKGIDPAVLDRTPGAAEHRRAVICLGGGEIRRS